MVEFVLTPPFLIPVAIAAVLGAAMMKTPEKAPDSYHLTVDIQKRPMTPWRGKRLRILRSGRSHRGSSSMAPSAGSDGSFAGAISRCQVPSPHACGNPAAVRLTVKYAPRFDYDGWMVINPAVFDGEL